MGDTLMILPTSPRHVITAMSSWMPSLVPLSMRTALTIPVGSVPIAWTGIRLRWGLLLFELQQSSEVLVLQFEFLHPDQVELEAVYLLALLEGGLPEGADALNCVPELHNGVDHAGGVNREWSKNLPAQVLCLPTPRCLEDEKQHNRR